MRDVNTDSQKRKQAADALHIASRVARNAGFMKNLPRQFDDDAMGEYNRLFGIAGRALNRSFDTAYAIGGLVDMVRANNEEGEHSGILNENTVSATLTAISLLSRSLNDALCDVASAFRADLKEAQR